MCVCFVYRMYKECFIYIVFFTVGSTVCAGVSGCSAGGTLDLLLSTTYCRSQMHLSRQLAQLHPELTMPMFSGKTIFCTVGILVYML